MFISRNTRIIDFTKKSTTPLCEVFPNPWVCLFWIKIERANQEGCKCAFAPPTIRSTSRRVFYKFEPKHLMVTYTSNITAHKHRKYSRILCRLSVLQWIRVDLVGSKHDTPWRGRGRLSEGICSPTQKRVKSNGVGGKLGMTAVDRCSYIYIYIYNQIYVLYIYLSIPLHLLLYIIIYIYIYIYI